MSNARHRDGRGAGPLADVIRRGFALYGGIGGQNHLFDFAIGKPLTQRLEAQLLWPNTIDRRQMPHQHIVVAPEAAALLNRHDVGGRLHHTERGRVSLGVGADLTDLQLGKIAAATAVFDLGQRHFDGFRDLLGPRDPAPIDGASCAELTWAPHPAGAAGLQSTLQSMGLISY